MDTPVETNTNEPSLKNKQKLQGKVLKTSLQGALIDVGNALPGFLHVSQVINPENPEEIIKSLPDYLQIGQEVTVWVKRVLKDHVELTMKEPLALEWKEISPEMTLHGTIVRLESFGAFVELGAERPGLVHVSELSHQYVKVPAEVVKVGDEVDVKVLEVDKRKKQIKLSIKALQEAPEAVEEEPRKGRRGARPKKEELPEEPVEVIPDPTFMEIALRQAMDRAEKRQPEISRRVKRERYAETDADELYDRTMRNKLSKDD